MPLRLAAARLCLATLTAGVLFVAPLSASADAPRIYKWVDENGIAHYTSDPERVPRNLRQRFGRGGGKPSPPLPLPQVNTTEAGAGWAEREALPDPGSPQNPATVGAEVARALPEAAAQPVEPPAADVAAADELDQRILALEASIAQDEDALQTLLARDSARPAIELADEQAFREIARRLPRLQADLRALRAERSQQSEP